MHTEIMRMEARGAPPPAFKADTWRQFRSFSWPLALQGVIVRRNYRAVATLRLCQWMAQRPPLVSRPLLPVARILHRFACHAAGIDLPWKTSIGPGLALTHGWGTVVNEHALIGSNVTLFHGVTLGQRDRIAADGSRLTGYPVIEDDVWIGPHAVVVGPVTIGRGSRIAAGACVFENVPAHSIVMGNPARVVKSDCAPDVMNRWEF
ncbi:MAG TPA: serine acetyltransferase [Ramlibacter sp.]|nr:serine acetyltransferase [Ramlibacter sp.]